MHATKTGFDHRSGRWVEHEGARLYVEERGNPQGTPLLLLHGGLMQVEDWNPVVPLLAGHRLIGLDSRGHGASTAGGRPLSYPQMQRDVEAVLDALDVPRATVLGLSDGGIVGYRLAALGKRLQVDRLVTIGARWDAEPPGPVRDLLAGVTGDSWRRKFPGWADTYERVNPEPDFDALVKATVRMWLDDAGYAGEAVLDIECPVLIVRGDNDHLVPLSSLLPLRERLKKASLANLPFAGHVVVDEQAALFVEVLKQFFAGG